MADGVHSFLTILDQSTGFYEAKGSKFWAYAFPFTNKENAKYFVDNLAQKHPKAVHFCYAYQIDSQTFRVNDDGEPAGTAGKPILNAILSQKLNEIFVVVVRYFGGTLLGASGLITAYKSAALDAINNATIVTKHKLIFYEIDCPISEVNFAMRLFKQFEVQILAQNFTENYRYNIQIKSEQKMPFLNKLKENYKLNYSEIIEN